MAKKIKKNPQSARTNLTLTVLQDLFILEGLKAGMKVGDIRKILRIDKRRVTNISKALPDQNQSVQEERK
jgi:DNA-binding MarR family transcriptional regulator